jgi:hypothetical protein
MGYGSRVLELLSAYYQGEITNVSDLDEEELQQQDVRFILFLTKRTRKPLRRMDLVDYFLKKSNLERTYLLC